MIQKYYALQAMDDTYFRGTATITGLPVWSVDNVFKFPDIDAAKSKSFDLTRKYGVATCIKTHYVITDIAAFETAILDARDKSTFYSEFFEDEFHEHFQKLLPE